MVGSSWIVILMNIIAQPAGNSTFLDKKTSAAMCSGGFERIAYSARVKAPG
jgi:hypothetical protein